MYCKKCGNQINIVGAEYCPVCGEKIERGEQTNVSYCTNCGAQVPSNAPVCPNCGFSTNNRRELLAVIKAERRNKRRLIASIVFSLLGAPLLGAILAIIGMTTAVNKSNKSEKKLGYVAISVCAVAALVTILLYI